MFESFQEKEYYHQRTETVHEISELLLIIVNDILLGNHEDMLENVFI
jgi:hypothetical protein